MSRKQRQKEIAEKEAAGRKKGPPVWILPAAAVLIAAVVLMASGVLNKTSGTSRGTERTTATGFYFDTVVTFAVYGADNTLLEDLQTQCARYEKLLSKTIEGSDVWRINNAGGETVTVDPETWQILKRAKEISELTGHAFCVTIAPLTALWDFTGGTERMPTEEERLAALPLVDDDALVLGENNTVTLPAGMEIDLGGIAKGYIADRLAAYSADRMLGGTLNFGGNVYAVGQKPDGSAFRIGLTDPDNPSGDPIRIIAVNDKTVVTSGTYERYFIRDGVTYHHILDPDTGLPADTDLVSATIVGTVSMDADAFATACIVLGREGALKLLKDNGLDGVLIGTDGSITTTPGFENTYPFQ